MRRWISALAALGLALTLALAGAPRSLAGDKVDINAADQAALESLPGIGPSKAAAILQYRTDHGPFTTAEQLLDVPGIGPSTFASLKDSVIVGKGGGAPAAKAPSDDAPAKAPTSAPKESAPKEGAPAAPSGACSGAVININKADATELDGLPGIGPSKAAAIVSWRVDNGNFGSCEQLGGVEGIGDKTLQQILPCCTVK